MFEEMQADEEPVRRQQPRKPSLIPLIVIGIIVGVLAGAGITVAILFSGREPPKTNVTDNDKQSPKAQPIAVAANAKDISKKKENKPNLQEIKKDPAAQPPEPIAKAPTANVEDLVALLESQLQALKDQEFDKVKDKTRLTQELVDVRNRYPSGSPGFSYQRISDIENRISDADRRISQLIGQQSDLHSRIEKLKGEKSK